MDMYLISSLKNISRSFYPLPLRDLSRQHRINKPPCLRQSDWASTQNKTKITPKLGAKSVDLRSPWREMFRKQHGAMTSRLAQKNWFCYSKYSFPPAPCAQVIIDHEITMLLFESG